MILCNFSGKEIGCPNPVGSATPCMQKPKFIKIAPHGLIPFSYLMLLNCWSQEINARPSPKSLKLFFQQDLYYTQWGASFWNVNFNAHAWSSLRTRGRSAWWMALFTITAPAVVILLSTTVFLLVALCFLSPRIRNFPVLPISSPGSRKSNRARLLYSKSYVIATSSLHLIDLSMMDFPSRITIHGQQSSSFIDSRPITRSHTSIAPM